MGLFSERGLEVALSGGERVVAFSLSGELSTRVGSLGWEKSCRWCSG